MQVAFERMAEDDAVVITVLVQQGTLRQGDPIVSGAERRSIYRRSVFMT